MHPFQGRSFTLSAWGYILFLFVGLRPFVDFCWTQSFVSFAKARTALRKAAFTKPCLDLASKLINEDPFSDTLFSKTVMKNVGDTLSSQSLSFSDILNLTPAAKSAHLKRRSVFVQALTAPPPKPAYQGCKGPSYMFKGNQKRGFRPNFVHNRGGSNNNNNPNRGGGKFRGPKFHRRPRGSRGGKQ